MIKLCIFDLDGTIADTLEDLAFSVNFALQKNGFPTHPIDRYRVFVGDGVMKLIQRASGSDEAVTVTKIKNDFDEYYALHSTDRTKAFDGCSEMLKRLKSNGIDIAVFSNKPDEFVMNILNTIYPDIRFAFAIGKQADFALKPCPDAMLNKISKMGINPSECVYIGDSDIDIFTAKNAGMTSCGVTWGFRGADELKKAGADFVVTSPQELFHVINTYLFEKR